MRLIPADVELMDAALAGDGRLAAVLGHPVVPGWLTFSEALPPIRAALAADAGAARWGTRLFLAGAPAELVGWGGFKGPPVDGMVELGYEIAEARRGRGLATGAVEAMLAEAFAVPDVHGAMAHTLPETNASNRVLEKAGFAFDRETEEDGRTVWRFSRRREPTPLPESPPPR